MVEAGEKTERRVCGASVRRLLTFCVDVHPGSAPVDEGGSDMEEGDLGGVQVDEDSVDQMAALDNDTGEATMPGEGV